MQRKRKKRKKKKKTRIPNFKLLNIPPRFIRGVLTEEEVQANKRRAQWLWRLKQRMEGWRERSITFHLEDKEDILAYVEKKKRERKIILRIQDRQRKALEDRKESEDD